MSEQGAAGGIADAIGSEAAQALAAARAFYGEEELNRPPVPRTLASQLRQVGESVWSTFAGETDDAEADDTSEMSRDVTDRDGFLDRATDPTAPDEVAFGYTGHGLASWWMCYQLVLPSLALFIRQSYGGPYRDSEAAGRTINAAFHDAETLIVIAGAARAAGIVAPGRRLVVVLDSRNSSFWGLSDDPEQWQDSDDPIGAATTFLRG